MAQPLRCYVFLFLNNSQNRSVKWFSSCRRCSLSKPVVTTTANNHKSDKYKRNVMAQPLRCYVFWFLNKSQNRSVKWFSSCRRCSLSEPAVTTTAANNKSSNHKHNVMAQPLRCYVFLFLNNSQNRSVKWFSSCRRCSLSKPAATTTAANIKSSNHKRNVMARPLRCYVFLFLKNY